jgi:hypothetical protein
MHLAELFDYKNRLVKDMLTDEEIVALIDPNKNYSNPKDMVYDNINPYEFYPEVIDQGKVYVCCDVDVVEVGGKPLYDLALYIWIFAHKSLLRLPEGGVRTDALCAKIDEKINGSWFYGLGKLNLEYVKRFAPMADFTGKVLRYSATDFNRINNNPKAEKPINRKADA